MEQIKYGRKRSGIKKEIIAKIDEWKESIDDDSIRGIIDKDAILTGGAIVSMLMGDPVNDFDFYFRTKESAKAVAQYYVKKFGQIDIQVKEDELENIKGIIEERVTIFVPSAGIAKEKDDKPQGNSKLAPAIEGADEKESYRPVFLSQNAITLSDKVQVVIRFYGEPEKIHDNYDFVHAMCYWDNGKKELVLPADAMEAMLSRTLVYKGSLYPIASIFRTKKFLERGWRITASQQLKIMWQISEIDLRDRAIIREQLTGVDQAYMQELINALENIDSEKINSTYVGSIIDKIFES